MFWEQEATPADGELLDIAVLAGGESSEADISLASGAHVAEALAQCGHQTAVFDPADVDLWGINWRQFDACFVAMHGGAGEDGRLQIELEELAVPYTGSGPVASRFAMSKTATKGRFLQSGIPTPPGISVHAAIELADLASRVKPLGYPLVVKPDSQGCSLGLAVAYSEADLAACVDRARHYQSFLVAERMISGREFSVAVIDRVPLPVLEIVTRGPLFDFTTKHGSGSARYEFPSDSDALAVGQIAVDAAEALGTRGLVRVDVMMDADGQPWVLEVNTIPGMTRRSLVPMIAQRAGISMPQLCDQLVRQCIVEEVLV